MFKIKITSNGPYKIEGAVNLIKETSEETDGLVNVIKTEKLGHDSQMQLCRCGKSVKKPFCDCTHESVEFDGTETADKTPYLARIRLHEGFGMDLADDGRCCNSHRCHLKNGDILSFAAASDNPENKAKAIEAACACPSGRFTAIENGRLIEKAYEPAIISPVNASMEICAGLYIKGDFEMEGADGRAYEKRNRVSLCRCGNSANKPFCDGAHAEQTAAVVH